MRTAKMPLRVIECGRRTSLRSARRPVVYAPSGDHIWYMPLRVIAFRWIMMPEYAVKHPNMLLATRL